MEELELYYDYRELTELASIFEVNWAGEIFAGNQSRWLPVARQLVEQIDRGNHYVMPESVTARKPPTAVGGKEFALLK